MKDKTRKDLNSLVSSSFNDLNLLLDSQKTIGKPVIVNEDLVIIPVSKVTFGFGTGGSEFGSETKSDYNALSYEYGDEIYPYGGGSLGGVSIKPVAFLLVSGSETKIIKMEDTSIYSKAFDMFMKALKKKK